VVTEDFKVIHHHSLDLIGRPETWVEAHMRVAEKWDGRMPSVGAGPGDWKPRARRAEAEAAAARAQAVSIQLQSDARLKEMTESLGWRLTEPLRRANALRRGLRHRRR
jgi:hypothetical protein